MLTWKYAESFGYLLAFFFFLRKLFLHFTMATFTKKFIIFWNSSLELNMLSDSNLDKNMHICSTGAWTQDLSFARQVLYQSSHSNTPFCDGYFQDRALKTIFPGFKP
jgi:hypothetical protein